MILLKIDDAIIKIGKKFEKTVALLGNAAGIRMGGCDVRLTVVCDPSLGTISVAMQCEGVQGGAPARDGAFLYCFHAVFVLFSAVFMLFLYCFHAVFVLFSCCFLRRRSVSPHFPCTPTTQS